MEELRVVNEVVDMIRRIVGPEVRAHARLARMAERWQRQAERQELRRQMREEGRWPGFEEAYDMARDLGLVDVMPGLGLEEFFRPPRRWRRALRLPRVPVWEEPIDLGAVFRLPRRWRRNQRIERVHRYPGEGSWEPGEAHVPEIPEWRGAIVRRAMELHAADMGREVDDYFGRRAEVSRPQSARESGEHTPHINREEEPERFKEPSLARWVRNQVLDRIVPRVFRYRRVVQGMAYNKDLYEYLRREAAFMKRDASLPLYLKYKALRYVENLELSEEEKTRLVVNVVMQATMESDEENDAVRVAGKYFPTGLHPDYPTVSGTMIQVGTAITCVAGYHVAKRSVANCYQVLSSLICH